MARITRSGKTFRHYPKLPSEVRMMINDEMNLKDMCRFSRCSRVCQKEVQKSEKCIYGLEFFNISKKCLKITVQHDRQVENRYHLVFKVKFGKKCIEYFRGPWEQLWSINLDISADLVQLATEHFKKLLSSYQNTIKQLVITGSRNYDFEIQSLNSLRCLKLSSCVENILQVISRRKKPLMYFAYHGEMTDKFLESDKYINQVQKEIQIPLLKLNYAQLRRLTAKHVKIHIGQLTPNDIFDFVTAWQNGEIWKSFECCTWILIDSNFEVEQMWKLLRITPDAFSKIQRFGVMHNLEGAKYAILSHYNHDIVKSLVFRTNQCKCMSGWM